MCKFFYYGQKKKWGFKKIYLLIFFTVFFNLNIYADFMHGGKPVWAINSDTAYILDKGYWVIDISGPITYGLSDRIHLGTIFWFWYEKMLNFYFKINLLKESQNTPAVSLLNKTLITTYKNNILYSSTSLILSKQIIDKLFLSGDYTIHTIDIIKIDESKSNFIINIIKYFGQNKKSNVGINFNSSIIYLISDITSFMFELSFILFDPFIQYSKTEDVYYFHGFNIYSGVGLEWKLGSGKDFILKLSILSNFFVAYLPYINISYKFK